MAKPNKKKAPPRPAAGAKKNSTTTSKKKTKKMGTTQKPKSTKPADKNEDDETVEKEDEDTDDEGDDDSDEDDEDDDEEGDDEEGGDNKPDGEGKKRTRDKSPIAKRMAKRLTKALGGLKKRRELISSWAEASDIVTDLDVAISGMDDAIAKLNAKPDDYKPRDRAPRTTYTFAEKQKVRVNGKKSREIYADIFGEEALDNLVIVKIKGKQAVVQDREGHKQAVPLSALAPREAT